ncbi:hypothetical protein [uncultured Tateyamaria sp.]|uniref:hypothetical protein n=1 Tax=uncultured Tateyamaria sp. TaxID=455651 RepID=UPI00262E7175|nr:hypothetical protein [uncultured Tateyamaria sp.]
MLSVDAQDDGSGAGAVQPFQQIGAALGMAIACQAPFVNPGEDGMAAGGESAPQFVEAAAQAIMWSIAVFVVLTVSVGRAAWVEHRAGALRITQ